MAGRWKKSGRVVQWESGAMGYKGPEHSALLAIARVAKKERDPASRLRLKIECRRRRASTRTPFFGLLAVPRRPCG